MKSIMQKVKKRKAIKKVFKSEIISRFVGKDCPACGSFQPAKAVYCTQCGTVMYEKCPDCGEPYTADDQFCRSCGKRLLRDTQ